MRIISFTLYLLLIGLAGCSGGDEHNFHHSCKIPIDPKRWYVLNNTGIDMRQLFDTQLHQQIHLGNGKILENYEAWYPISDGEQMTINSIEMFDWEGTNEQRPTKIYAILSDWQRVPLADFLSTRSHKWVGPYPNDAAIFALKQPVGNIRYIVINTWGNLPTEIEFYGPYTPPVSKPLPVAHYPLRNYFGINGFEWNFEDPKTSNRLDPIRLNALKSFTGFRHYLDWEKIENKEGSFTFNPAKNGGWNYDTIYQWCYENNTDVIVCLKDNPPWMLETYPENQRNNENIPIRFGKDPAGPNSYLELAKAAFQFAARYGHTYIGNELRALVKVDSTPRWTNDITNTVKTGLGYITYMECGNEPDKWWKGRKSYQSGREYAANLSAFYDGNKNTMGPGVGVKNADPAMQVVMAGVATPTTDYLKGIIDWCREFRGKRKDGSTDLPFDIINYHYYSCEYAPGIKPESNQAGESGVAPELSNTESIARSFLQTKELYNINLPVWVTETGYDINQGSPQRSLPISKKSALETQADWNLRTSLLYSRLGIGKVFFYELTDDNGTNTKYGTCGLINENKTRRPAADYLFQVNKYFGIYVYNKTIKKDPFVDRYVYNNAPMYVLYIPGQTGRTAPFTLDLSNADSAYIYIPKAGSGDMEIQKKKTKNGTIEVFVTETPVFVTSSLVLTK